jgi:hypothetical protein
LESEGVEQVVGIDGSSDRGYDLLNTGVQSRTAEHIASGAKGKMVVPRVGMLVSDTTAEGEAAAFQGVLANAGEKCEQFRAVVSAAGLNPSWIPEGKECTNGKTCGTV